MTAIVDNSTFIINGDCDISTGSLGETVILSGITLSFSLVPGVSALGLTKYYNVYVVQTNTPNINITLPTVEVATGWYCRIDLTSTAGTGSLLISNGATIVAGLNSNSTFGSVQTSVTLVKIGGTNSWATMYSVPASGTAIQTPIITRTGLLMKNYISAKFFSFCDVLGSGVINVNTTADVALRWVNPNGRYFDTAFYNVVSNTRITALIAGSYSFAGIIGINNVSSANLNNLRIRPRLNGLTFLTSFSVVASQIQLFASGVYYFEGAFVLAANDYVEILIGKSAISVGTNPVDLANTSMSVTLVGST